MGHNNSKIDNDTINWNNIETDNMSSTLPDIKSVPVDVNLLLDKLNLIYVTESDTNNNISGENNLSTISPIINDKMYNNNISKYQEKNKINKYIIIGGDISSNIDIIVSRYNEDLEWMNEYPFNQFKYIVYNKGTNDNFNKKYIKEIININNVGRESHTYLYHIISNYNNLAKINIFFPGSLDIEKKNYKSKYLLKLIKKNNKAYLVGKYTNNLKKKFEKFYLDEWQSTNSKNNKINPENILLKSNIRPYSKWFTNRFGNIIVNYYCFYGIFSIDKRDIIQHPKSYYEDLIKDLNTHSNPEAGHYYERSWTAVFHPLKYTKIKLSTTNK